MPLEYRRATSSDAEAIARIHTDNWQSGYRGAFTDTFLDDDLPGFHRHEWHGKLSRPAPRQYAECAILNGEIAGFVFGYGAFDAELGSFIDNLHVAASAQGAGIGATLMRRAAGWFET